MSVEQMRGWLKRQYGGAWKWISKVNSMSDQQVMAVYFRMVQAKRK